MDNLTWLTLPAELASLQPATEFLRQGAVAACMSGEDCAKLDLVVEELVVNIARYGYTDGIEGQVHLGYHVGEPGLLTVQICDSGVEFNPFHADPPDFGRGLSDRPIGGLGIFLVQSIAESIGYERKEDRNVISFRMRSGEREELG